VTDSVSRLFWKLALELFRVSDRVRQQVILETGSGTGTDTLQSRCQSQSAGFTEDWLWNFSEQVTESVSRLFWKLALELELTLCRASDRVRQQDLLKTGPGTIQSQ